jgi:hypothetical protein
MNMPVMNAPASPPATDPLDALFDVMFKPMNAQGVYARTGAYEAVVEALSAFISARREDGTEVFRFPPVMSRAHLERHGYLKSFPEPARLRLLPRRHRDGDPQFGPTSISPAATGPRTCRPPTSC